jgi:thiamine pyrophosphokinase
MVALILAGGDAPDRAYLERHWPSWSDGRELVIAADGGARHAAALDRRIDLWVGDGDSTTPAELAALRDAGVEIVTAPTEKDETDTELAIRTALARGVDGIVLLGATGGERIDHELANLALLAMPQLVDVPAVIYTPHSRIVLLHGGASSTIVGRPGDLVSLIPFGGDAEGVTTHGLRYPLAGERLPLGTPRGISNEVLDDGARVVLEGGSMLVVETPGTIDR